MNALNPIKQYIMKPHLPTQIFLYSCPVVNLVVRVIQDYSYFDILGTSPSDDKIQAFKDQQVIFRKAISISYKTQAAAFITTLALALLFPPTSIPLALSQATTAFFVGIPSLWLMDKFYYKSNMKILASGEKLYA